MEQYLGSEIGMSIKTHWPVLPVSLFVWLVRVIIGGVIPSVYAQDNSWTNASGGNWEDAWNWSAGSPSGNQSVLFITNAMTKTISVSSTTATYLSSMTFSNLILSARSGENNALYVAVGGVNPPVQILNSLLVGSGGELDIPWNPVSSSVIVDRLGAAGSWSGGLTIGLGGPGSVMMNGGTVNAQYVNVGCNAGAQGNLTVVAGTNQLLAGFTIGYNPAATGSVWVQDGALLNCYSILLAGNPTNSLTGGGVGQLVVSNATVNAFAVKLGSPTSGFGSANGTLTINGGTLNLPSPGGALVIGDYSPNTGTVWLAGGQITATNWSPALAFSPAGIWVGYNAGCGRMTVSNGIVLAQGVNVNIHGSPMSEGPSVLTVVGGSMLLSSNLTVGFGYSVVNIFGGNHYITNALGNAVIDMPTPSGYPVSFVLTNGSITADALLLEAGSFVFSGGTLSTRATGVSNGFPFVVGNGTNAATYRLNGGIHSFSKGLIIASNALLTGCGTINGSVTIAPGATVLLDCGGTMSISGNLTNNGALQAIDGSTLEVYGPVSNHGVIDVINGITNFHGAFFNTGTLLTAGSIAVSQVSPSQEDFVVQVPSVMGHTYQMQSSISLAPTNWLDAGSSQPGNQGILTFTDPGGLTNTPARFYRIQVTAP